VGSRESACAQRAAVRKMLRQKTPLSRPPAAVRKEFARIPPCASEPRPGGILTRPRFSRPARPWSKVQACSRLVVRQGSSSSCRNSLSWLRTSSPNISIVARSRPAARRCHDVSDDWSTFLPLAGSCHHSSINRLHVLRLLWQPVDEGVASIKVMVVPNSFLQFEDGCHLLGEQCVGSRVGKFVQMHVASPS
jgi:hypothetical protein